MAEKAVKSIKTANKSEKPAKVAPYKEKCKELLKHIYNKMAEHDQSIKGFAEAINISYPHATALMSGDRWWAGTDREVIERLAKYLGVSVLQVYYWAGFLQPTDHYFEETMETVSNQSYMRAKASPYMGQIMCSPESWANLPMDAKAMFVIMIEIMSLEITAKRLEVEPSVPNRTKIGAFRAKYGFQ
jgi:hypothetical protein